MAETDRLLENVDWSTITHAYGAASDTPAHLRDLKSSRKSKAALGELFSSINHQGDHSEAGLCSAPYLLELIGDHKLPNLAIVLDLILGIAVGNPDDFLLMGEKIGDNLKRCREHAKQNSYRGWKLPNQCHQAVRAGIPKFVNLLEHTNKNVSWQSAFNLSWFPHAGSTAIAEISQRFEQHKKSPEHFANYLLPLGLLQWHCNKKRGNSKSVAEYLGHSNKLIRYSSAIYCSWFRIGDDIVNVLRDIATDQDFDGCRDNPYQIVFCCGNLMQYAEELLERQSASSKNRG